MNFALESRPADCSDSLLLAPLCPAMVLFERRRPWQSPFLFSHASICCFQHIHSLLSIPK